MQTDELRAKLEKAEQTQRQNQKEEEEDEEMEEADVIGDMKFSPPSFVELTTSRKSVGGEATISSQDFSRVLSETLQVLEESVCVPPTPGRHSVSSSISALNLLDLEMAKVRGSTGVMVIINGNN